MENGSPNSAGTPAASPIVRCRWPPHNGHKTYAMRANETSPLQLRIILHRAAITRSYMRAARKIEALLPSLDDIALTDR